MKLFDRFIWRRRNHDQQTPVFCSRARMRRHSTMDGGSSFLSVPMLIALVLFASGITTTHGGSSSQRCTFPPHWTGKWFQSGLGVLHVNSTTIETKGECYENDGDKFVIYEKLYNCYKCMVIHEKHVSVLQYKESGCESTSSLSELCYSITGDAALYSMFRKQSDGEPIQAVSCPFKQAPFKFSYNRGFGDCSNPPSRAESCTDDSRLVLKYQACPDIQGTESNVEELICLATWKEGSTRYLLGRITQPGRRGSLVSDEDQYRCFIYERGGHGHSGQVTYNIAQSGDATCNGLTSVIEGSRTMRLTTADNQHSRCKFPPWITDHHTWLSLDHKTTYKFSLRNATLKISMQRSDNGDSVNEPGSSGETRVVCHSILMTGNKEQKVVQIVAHVTAGCDSGYVCMVFYRRDANIIEIQKSQPTENQEDACKYFDHNTASYTTLITPSLHPKKCPHFGRYTVAQAIQNGGERRKRRQQTQQYEHQNVGDLQGGGAAEGGPKPPECLGHDYQSLAIGCSESPETLEFKSASCTHQPISAYMCHGGWQENNTHYLIASPVARKSTDALRYCLVYQFTNGLDQPGLLSSGIVSDRLTAGRGDVPQAARNEWTHLSASAMKLSAFAGSCYRHQVPGLSGVFAFNFTTNGTCAESRNTSGVPRPMTSLVTLLMTLALLLSIR